MIYYRIALQKNQSIEWEWASTILNSLDVVFQLRQRYSTLADEQMRVFMASSVEYMDILLVRENMGLSANSWTMDQLIQEPQRGEFACVQKFESELGWNVIEEQSAEKTPGLSIVLSKTLEPEVSDYDEPYVFALPSFMPHTAALLDLMLKVRSGELVP